MRRNRSALLNVIAFSSILLLIVYANLPSPASSLPNLFNWTTVRYRSQTRQHPPPHGVCPGVSDQLLKPVLVVSRVQSESSTWLDSLSAQYHICSYTADTAPKSASTNLQTPANRGHESMAYLTFIIDNYDRLPDTGIVFIHGSRFAWHNDDPLYDNLSLLRQLNISRALRGPPGPATGYWNMRCDWSAGMCDANSDDAKAQGSWETGMRAMLEPNNKRLASDRVLPGALRAIFGGGIHSNDKSSVHVGEASLRTLLGRKDVVRSQCCAQFVVARDNIRAHAREEYIALRQWLLDGNESTTRNRGQDISAGAVGEQDTQHSSKSADSSFREPYNTAAPSDDLIAGRILSYIWHILFLPPTSSQHDSDVAFASGSDTERFRQRGLVDLTYLNQAACPRADECYCRLYGRCDLNGCDQPGRCKGQYRVPSDFKLPKNWAELHQ